MNKNNTCEWATFAKTIVDACLAYASKGVDSPLDAGTVGYRPPCCDFTETQTRVYTLMSDPGWAVPEWEVTIDWYLDTSPIEPTYVAIADAVTGANALECSFEPDGTRVNIEHDNLDIEQCSYIIYPALRRELGF